MNIKEEVAKLKQKFAESVHTWVIMGCTAIIVHYANVIIDTVSEFKGYATEIENLKNKRIVDSATASDKNRGFLQLISSLQNSDANQDKKIWENKVDQARQDVSIDFLKSHSLFK